VKSIQEIIDRIKKIGQYTFSIEERNPGLLSEIYLETHGEKRKEHDKSIVAQEKRDEDQDKDILAQAKKG